MTRLRMFLAWILLAALPLQGYAAAAMLYCGPAAAAVMAAESHAAGHGAHSHAAHESNDSNDSHDEAAPLDAVHACSVCAACGHSVALAGTAHRIASPVVPQLSDTRAPYAFPTRPAPVPDKPPRA